MYFVDVCKCKVNYILFCKTYSYFLINLNLLKFFRKGEYADITQECLMGKILIVDDSQMNREILADMLEEYEILEAENGKEAIAMLNERANDISLILLDMIMPEMDGLEVLEIMSKNSWIDDIPVIMISSEDSPVLTHTAYELGVTEFIRRPFDSLVVQKRCHNIIALYSKQKKLVDLFADQFYEREKNSRMMIDILAHIVEFRNNECGLHVKNVQNYTEILLKALSRMTDKYQLSEADISLICNAAALHDIGKISIPDEILNKPGRLTNEEYQIMKNHSAAGARMLSDLPFHEEEPIVKYSYAIARWHHERWDGRGYPDGLKGDEIPIAAQVVSLADVYDALTADRVYKKAYTHEKSMEMILNGECGTFNPLLLQCLEETQEEMRAVKEKGSGLNTNDEHEIKAFARELLKNDALYSSDRLLRKLEYERLKNRFFEKVTGSCSFEYSVSTRMLSFSENSAAVLGLPETIMDPHSDWRLAKFFGKDKLDAIISRIRGASVDDPVVMFYFHQFVSTEDGKEINSFLLSDSPETNVPENAKCFTYKLICLTTWTSEEPPSYTGVIGKLVPYGYTYGMLKGVDSIDFKGIL